MCYSRRVLGDVRVYVSALVPFPFESVGACFPDTYIEIIIYICRYLRLSTIRLLGGNNNNKYIGATWTH